MRKGLKRITAPAFTSAGRTEVEIKHRNLLSSLLLRVAYTWTVTGGTGAGTVFPDAAHRLVRLITLYKGGKAFFTVRGHTLGKMLKLFGTEEYSQTVPSDDAAAAYTGVSFIEIPLYMLHSLLADEFSMPPDPNNPIRAVIDWAGPDDLTYDHDYTSAAFSNVSVELFEQSLLDTPHLGGIVLVRKFEKDVAAAGDLTFELANGLNPGEELRWIILESFEGGASGIEYQHSSDIIETIRIEANGQDEYEEVSFEAVQQLNKKDYALSSLETGVAVWDAAEDKRTGRGELLTLGRNHDLKIPLTVAAGTGDTKVVLTTVSVVR